MPAQRRMSANTKALYKRLHDHMLAAAEQGYSWSTVAELVEELNMDGSGEPQVTYPQVHRILKMLHADGLVQRWGKGKQQWRARTVGERLRAAQDQARRDRRSKLVTAMLDRNVDCRNGALDGVWLSLEAADALYQMIVHHPRTAARYGFGPKPPSRNTQGE